MMDEMQSVLCNDSAGCGHKDNVKKKTMKRNKYETPKRHKLEDHSELRTENRHEKRQKGKKKRKLSPRIPTSNKKKRKLIGEDEVVIIGETSVMDCGVKSVHQVKAMKALPAESQEIQGSGEGTAAKTKKKKKKNPAVSQTNCDRLIQESALAEELEVSHMSDQGSALTANLIGTAKRKKRNKRLNEPLIDPNHLNELKEFFPNVESKDEQEINKMILYDLPRFKEFKEQGIALRRGRFSAAENERLRENVRDFLALTEVTNATKLFHPKRFPEEKQELTKLKKVYRFFERIADGIPRLCHDVFNRGRKVFDAKNYKGRFTKEEIKSLLKYQSLHGNNWQKISELTGRSSYSLEKRFAHITTAIGPWSIKEEQRLLKAVRDHVVSVLKSKSPDNTTPNRVSREMLYQKLPWSNIALKVKTRCWSKCREKWMAILTVRMSSGTCMGRKAQEAKIRLIKAMYQMQVEDVTDVDWDDLTAVFGDVPPAHVQGKWHQLKVCYVPNWKTKCFGDIVDFLYEKILPGLMKDCNDLDHDELKVDQKDSFFLDKIFQDIDENVCYDSDVEKCQKEDTCPLGM